VQDGESSFPRAGKLIWGSGNSISPSEKSIWRRETRFRSRRGQSGAGKFDSSLGEVNWRPGNSIFPEEAHSRARETHLDVWKAALSSRHLGLRPEPIAKHFFDGEGVGVALQAPVSGCHIEPEILTVVIEGNRAITEQR
jgi:hypothetical protein